MDDKGELPATSTLFVHPGSTISEYSIAFAQVRGLTFGLLKEEYDNAAISSERMNLFVDVHPFPGLQLELWQRKETGSRTFNDTLALMHLYYDW